MEQKKENKPTIAGTISALVFLILIAYFFLNYSNSCSSGTPTAEDTLNKIKAEAFVKSQTYVSSFLKAPGSAKFPSILDSDVSITSLGDNTWKVSAWVDAQNSFGALIRNWYSCTMKRTGEEVWQLKELYINGEKYY